MQIDGTDIERQCDDEIVNLLKQDPNKFLKLLEKSNVNSLIKFDGAIKAIRKSPSRHHSTGQTDIGVFLNDGVRNTHILIENKVMSPFTYLQPERYQDEVDGLNQSGDIIAYSVLVCPQKYLSTSSESIKFNLTLSYEDILSKFGASVVLEQGIKRCQQGWIAEEVPAVTDNFLGYVDLTRQFKNLHVKTKPTNKPMQSRTIYFYEDKAGLNLPHLPKIRFNHQWQEGRTKILFDGWGKHRDILEPMMSLDLKDTKILVDPNKTKSLGLMIPTPVINNHKSFEQQKHIMLKGLESAEYLRNFLVSNKDLSIEWANTLSK